MRHKASKTLYKYWNNLRKDRLAPERSEIEPSDLRHILGDTFILEIDTRLRTISFRLAGTRLCNSHGKELKGYGFLCMWNDESNLQIVKAVGSVYRDFKAAVFSYEVETKSGRRLDYEMVMLPLLSTKDNSIRTLGVATPKSTPFWLGSDPVVSNRLHSVRVIDPDISNPISPPGLVPMKRELESLSKPEDTGRRVGHLTVLDGGRQP